MVDPLDTVDGIANQRITYINLEPVFTNIAAPLTIIAPPSANAINYVEGSHSGDAAAPYNGNTTGVVTIDDALAVSTNPHDLTVELKRVGLVA